MAHLTRITVPQAAYLGAVGCACLGITFVLVRMLKCVDKILNDNQKILTNNNLNLLNNKISTIDRMTTQALVAISIFAKILLSCLGFLLWSAGTVCITYAAIGPLLY